MSILASFMANTPTRLRGASYNEELAEIEEPSKECLSLKDDDLADRKLAPVGC